MPKLHYYQQAGALNRELKREIPPERLKALHHKQPWRHFLIAGRQIALLISLPLIIYHFHDPLIWIPAAILMGFVIFCFTILLHEAVHKCIFNSDPHNLSEFFGHIYGALSGLSYSQFKRWHTDHHNQLGSHDRDPKRAHLSPKRNARWFKLLYMTPALYPIYMLASGKENKTYPKELQSRIKRERLISIAFMLTVIGTFFWISPWFAVKAWLIPQFVVFPFAFTLNRLGQHYIINPDDVANWSTLIRPNPVWNFLFLYSSYHLEHHYFPAVPFYNLKPLQKELDPFFERRGIRSYTYTELLKLWFVNNHKPHTRPAAEAQAVTAQPAANTGH